jgi:L-iditol 2-dehydrogenase
MSLPKLPETMTACVLTRPGEFEIQHNIPVPQPGPDEVLCKIQAVAICGSDPEIIRGELAGSWPPSYPFIAGHEWSGEVVALGPGVVEFKVGDRVAGEAHKGCGYCENCKQGRYTLCLNYGKSVTGHRHYGFTTYGAYCQYQVYSIKSVNHMPDNVSFEEGSLCDTASVALHGIDVSGITSGGTSVVIGPGPIGLCTMRLAKALGSVRVIMVGRGSRLESAKRLGADDIVNFMDVEPIAAVRELTGGLGVDQVFECSGAPGTLTQAIRMVKKGGTVSLIGVAKDGEMESVPYKYITHNEIAIFGSRANPNTSRRALAMMSSGTLNVRDFITHRFALASFSQALESFVQRKENAVKVVILPNQN